MVMDPAMAFRLAKMQHKQLMRDANQAKLAMEAKTYTVGDWRFLISRTGVLLITLGTKLRKIGIVRPDDADPNNKLVHSENIIHQCITYSCD